MVRRVLFDSIASPARAGPWLYPLPFFLEVDMLKLHCSLLFLNALHFFLKLLMLIKLLKIFSGISCCTSRVYWGDEGGGKYCEYWQSLRCLYFWMLLDGFSGSGRKLKLFQVGNAELLPF